MNCKKCNHELSEQDITIEIGDTEIDLLIECPECGARTGTFINNADLTDY